MPQSDQGITRDRYTLIPRTAIFLRRGDSYLLLKGASTKRLWANKYNGLGGHVERGEDILSAARRELLEETGLTADLWLCGTLIVDAGETGIGLYFFLGENPEGELRASREGLAEWIPFERIGQLPVVEDLPILLSKIHGMQRGDPPFSARSFYNEEERLVVEFADKVDPLNLRRAGITETFMLSTEHPAVKVDLGFSIQVQTSEHISYGTHIDPSLIPQDLLDPLWSFGICQGVHRAMGEREDIVNAPAMEIDIQKLLISEPLKELNDDELWSLGRELGRMMYKALRAELSKVK